MASSQKTSEEVKVLDGASVIEQRRQSFARELTDLRVEAAGISDELNWPSLIPSQRESRTTRLNVLRRRIAEIQSVIAYLGENQTRVENAVQQFDLVTLPKDWFIGLVEPLVRKPRSKAKGPGRLFRRIIFTMLGFVAGETLILLTLVEWAFTSLFFMALSFFAFLFTEPFDKPEDFGPPPHSVFKGVIPMSALERYNALKTAGLFNSIIVASPQKDAFIRMGVRYDPVMVGVVGPGIRFDWNGFATVESAGLTDSCVFLFEIARWDTAADLGNLGKA